MARIERAMVKQATTLVEGKPAPEQQITLVEYLPDIVGGALCPLPFRTGQRSATGWHGVSRWGPNLKRTRPKGRR